MSNRYLQMALCPECAGALVTDGRLVRCPSCGYDRDGGDNPDQPTTAEKGAFGNQQLCEGCEE
mgnify:CR=1 FL=1